MNLTKEVENQIVKELQSCGLPETLLEGIKDKMAKNQIGYQLAIQEYIESTTRKPQQKMVAKPISSEVKQTGNSFQSRIGNTKELVKQQILSELINAEKEAYQAYFSGSFDTSDFQYLGEEIQDHFHTLRLPIAG